MATLTVENQLYNPWKNQAKHPPKDSHETMIDFHLLGILYLYFQNLLYLNFVRKKLWKFVVSLVFQVPV